MYTVKQVAQKLGLSEHTIRFYTDKGFVPNLKRDKNNVRLFDEKRLKDAYQTSAYTKKKLKHYE